MKPRTLLIIVLLALFFPLAILLLLDDFRVR